MTAEIQFGKTGSFMGGDVYSLTVAELPNFCFEIRFLGGDSVFCVSLVCAIKQSAQSHRYKKKIKSVQRGKFKFASFHLGEIYSDAELEKRFGGEEDGDFSSMYYIGNSHGGDL